MRNNEDRLGANLPRQDATPQQQLIQQDSNNKPSLEFMIPTEFISLPSKGMFYPQHHPLYGKDTIEIKQMTAKEEDILTSRNLLKKGIALDKLIQSLVVDKNINCDTLTIEDRNAIIIAARISAYGQDYETSVVCPSCNEKIRHKFNLMEKIKSYEDAEKEIPTLNENNNFSFALPATKWNVVCRVLNGYDEKELLRLSELKKKKVNDGDSTLVDQLNLILVSIQGITDKNALRLAIENMPASDAKYVRRKYQSYVANVDMKHPFVCKNCNHESEMEVPLTADFFWFK